MKVRVINRTDFVQYVDLEGKGGSDSIITLGARETQLVEIPTEKQFVKLSKQFKNKVLFRKVK